MDSARFDRLTQSLSSLLSRRVLTGALGALALPVLAQAKKKRKKKHKKKKAKKNEFGCLTLASTARTTASAAPASAKGRKTRRDARRTTRAPARPVRTSVSPSWWNALRRQAPEGCAGRQQARPDTALTPALASPARRTPIASRSSGPAPPVSSARSASPREAPPAVAWGTRLRYPTFGLAGATKQRGRASAGHALPVCSKPAFPRLDTSEHACEAPRIAASSRQSAK